MNVLTRIAIKRTPLFISTCVPFRPKVALQYEEEEYIEILLEILLRRVIMKVADNKKLAAQPGTYNGFRTLLTIYVCKGSLEKSETEINLWNTSYLHVIKWPLYHLVRYSKGLQNFIKVFNYFKCYINLKFLVLSLWSSGQEMNVSGVRNKLKGGLDSSEILTSNKKKQEKEKKWPSFNVSAHINPMKNRSI